MASEQHPTKQRNHATDSLQNGGVGENDGKCELILNWYKINGKNLLGEEVISQLDIQTLMMVLGHPIWNHIYHCWSIENKHMPRLQTYIQHVFEADKYVYFIEAYNNLDQLAD